MRRFSLHALVVVVALLVLAPGALAHTKLVASVPADGSTVKAAPKQVVLTFSTDVASKLEEVRVVDPDGKDVASDARADGTQVRVRFAGERNGTYSVGWRVLGADGHPIRGDFAFTLRVPESSTEADDASPSPTPAPRDEPEPDADVPMHAAHQAASTYPAELLEAVSAIARVLFYLTLLIVVGGAIFSSLIARGWRPRHFRRSCLLLFASSLTIFVTNLALAGEYSVWGVINPWNFVPHATTPVGRVSLACAAMALVMLRGYNRLRDAAKTGDQRVRIRFAIAAIVLGVIPAFGGHAVAADVAWVRIPADMLHLLAASVWFGGIVQLQAVAGASYAKHPAVYPAVRRFAHLAFASVITLVVTGTIAVLLEVGFDVGDLVGTEYGRLVLAKIVLLAFTIPLAKANQERHIPELLEMTRRSSTNLRRYVVFEILLVATIIAVTSWLVYATPPKHLEHARHASMSHAK